MASNGWNVAGGRKARKAAKMEAALNRLLAPAEQTRHKIIVGVDYGTTFSGMSSGFDCLQYLGVDIHYTRGQLCYDRQE